MLKIPLAKLFIVAYITCGCLKHTNIGSWSKVVLSLAVILHLSTKVEWPGIMKGTRSDRNRLARLSVLSRYDLVQT